MLTNVSGRPPGRFSSARRNGHGVPGLSRGASVRPFLRSRPAARRDTIPLPVIPLPVIPLPGPRVVRAKPDRDPLMHPTQLAPNQIRQHALNDPARILSVPVKY